jgi:hypothetical protein
MITSNRFLLQKLIDLPLVIDEFDPVLKIIQSLLDSKQDRATAIQLLSFDSSDMKSKI